MAWYSGTQLYHYLQYGAIQDKVKRQSRSLNKPGKQFPRPTQEAEKEHGPFQDVLPRTLPPPRLTEAPGYKPVLNKKAHKNIAYELSKKKG